MDSAEKSINPNAISILRSKCMLRSKYIPQSKFFLYLTIDAKVPILRSWSKMLATDYGLDTSFLNL